MFQMMLGDISESAALGARFSLCAPFPAFARYGTDTERNTDVVCTGVCYMHCEIESWGQQNAEESECMRDVLIDGETRVWAGSDFAPQGQAGDGAARAD